VSKRRRKSSSESSLADAVQDLASKLDEFLRRLTPQSGDTSDIVVVLVLLWMLMQSRTPIQPPPQYPVVVPPPKRQLTVSEIEQIIKQCEKSKEPLQCIRDMLYGG